MKPLIDLHEVEDNWRSEIGGAIAGERVVVRGRDLFTDLKNYSWLKLLLFMISGREFGEIELELLDKLWALTISYPDPRVWNNRIGALAGTVRSTGSLGVSAGCAVSEAKVYGGQATLEAFAFLSRCDAEMNQGRSIQSIIEEEIEINKFIYGFGRPIVSQDERIEPVMKIVEQCGYQQGKFINLAFEIQEILIRRGRQVKMNAGALIAAIGADVGLSEKEFYLWLLCGYNAGITACFLDAYNKEEGTLFPLRCDRISYNGIQKRTWE